MQWKNNPLPEVFISIVAFIPSHRTKEEKNLNTFITSGTLQFQNWIEKEKDKINLNDNYISSNYH